MVRELQHQRDADEDLACTNFCVDEKTREGLPVSSARDQHDKALVEGGGEQDQEVQPLQRQRRKES